MQNNYFSKVMLFGEYGILYGTKALALPFREFGGYFITSKVKGINLGGFYEHIQANNQRLKYRIELKKVAEDIKNNLVFNSNIPIGYGLGSSGALTAAMYKEYNTNLPEDITNVLEEVKNDLAILESFYHGNSSGIDPLTSLLNRAVLVHNKSVIRPLDIQFGNSDYVYMLIDSGMLSETSGLVTSFKDKLTKNIDFMDLFIQSYHDYSDKAIDALIDNDYDTVFSNFSSLSQYQLEHMSMLIPEHLHSLFKTGLREGNFALKICGSGGGGYFLAMVKSHKQMDLIQQNRMNLV
jgi:mevalonate kinase